MGAMRSSKREEGLSFHLRNKVQPTATAPTVEPITMIMMMVLRATWLSDEADEASAAADGVGLDSVTERVTRPADRDEVGFGVSVGVTEFNGVVLAALLEL